jgi:antirestriction protein
MLITAQTMIPNNLLPVEIDLSDFSDAAEFAQELYNRSRDYGLVMIPAKAHIEGYESTLDVATATIEEIWALHEASEEHGEPFGKWLSVQGEPGSDMTDWGSDFQEVYQGEHSSRAAWAEDLMSELYHETYSLLEELNMLSYFDFEAWADSELGHDYSWTEDYTGSVFVFRNA